MPGVTNPATVVRHWRDLDAALVADPSASVTGVGLLRTQSLVSSEQEKQLPNVLDEYIYRSIYISPMTVAQVQAFLPLKSQWFHIMLALAGGEQHGYGIMQDVLDRTTGKVRLWPATLYGSIKRLIEADLIEESNKRPAPADDDARRRYYRLTPLGKRVLDAECDRLQALVQSIKSKRAMVAGQG
jgi:DNA-binding PadR family transcriptional regulator